MTGGMSDFQPQRRESNAEQTIRELVTKWLAEHRAVVLGVPKAAAVTLRFTARAASVRDLAPVLAAAGARAERVADLLLADGRLSPSGFVLDVSLDSAYPTYAFVIEPYEAG